MSSKRVNFDALVITPAKAVGIPVTDIKHVVREINRMRKASTWLKHERQRQRDIQQELRVKRSLAQREGVSDFSGLTTNKRENK